MARNEELFNAIMNGKRKDVAVLVQAEVNAGTNVGTILMDSMIPAMREIGARFSRNEVYVPEMLIAARAMQAGLNIIDPLLTKSGHESLGKVAVGSVKGDLHDIGKNLVAMMVKGAGYEIMDLGVDCDIAKYDEAVSNGAQVIMLSALLTTTMPYMKEIVTHFKAKGSSVKILIGGAPVTQDYANEIGADGYATDANQAVAAVEKALGKKS
ncbi:MAG: cobalamin-dependent protein [Verrucomicrobia bacterium]|nr:cobalamin-dependent protein [Verrucomicrobiota bacterium]